MLQVAPAVLNRFQNRLNSSAGRFAEAATAKASATRNAMLSFCAGIASAIDTAPIPTAANRATRSSDFSDGFSLAITFAYRSCAKDDADVSVSPATTARIVANATA